jgi:tetratricopeptide (TPR) repeat protein
MAIGTLAAAEHNLRRRIDLCREVGDEFRDAVGHQEVGRLLAYREEFGEAEEQLKVSTKYWKKTDEAQGVCIDETYRALWALLMGDHAAALTAAQKARELAEVRKYEGDFWRSEWLLGAALTGVASPQKQDKLLAEAETHLTEALTRCGRINKVELEPDILLAWAGWHKAKGKGQEAKKQAEEALAIADRCEYRLKQAEIHNFLAKQAMEAGDRKTAQQHAETAYERAWCAGPPHCYKPALEQAEKMLKQLGVPLPRLAKSNLDGKKW